MELDWSLAGLSVAMFLASVALWALARGAHVPGNLEVHLTLDNLLGGVLFLACERWAWFALWYYPVFWTAHLAGGLPPGKEHGHQIVFILLSLAGLLFPVREFFPRSGARTPKIS